MSGTDFNDLHVLQGLDAVREQLSRGVENFRVQQARPLQQTINHADLWREQLIVTKDGSPKADIANLVLILKHDARWRGVLGYCDFSYRLMKRKSPPFDDGCEGEWTDADTTRLRIWMSRNYGFTPRDADALNGVLVAAQTNRFHPVREYLCGLVWDGKHRLYNWLHTYLGAAAFNDGDTGKYTNQVGVMWVIGGVARVMQPPVKVDTVLILEGLQGLGKSTALSILAGEWFSDSSIAIGDKDGYQLMQGVWIIELAELDSWHRGESTRNKQFFSSSQDRYRPSYGRQAQTFPRQCIFAGSTNQDNYFKDATGNRRYWPVACSGLNAEALRRDRDQLWAEAVHLYHKGHRWFPDSNDKHLFEQQQEQRFDADVWEEKIVDWLFSIAKTEVSMAEIFEDALKMPPTQMKPPEQKRIGLIMSHLQWSKHRPREPGGTRRTVYQMPEGWRDKK